MKQRTHYKSYLMYVVFLLSNMSCDGRKLICTVIEDYGLEILDLRRRRVVLMADSSELMPLINIG